MSVERRLAQLERIGTGDGGTGVWGVGRVHWLNEQGPDEVKVGTTGETMPLEMFTTRYPRGLLMIRTEYGNAVAINDFNEIIDTSSSGSADPTGDAAG